MNNTVGKVDECLTKYCLHTTGTSVNTKKSCSGELRDVHLIEVCKRCLSIYIVELYVPRPPFCCHHLLTVERIIQLNDPPTFLPQGTRVFQVVPHQFTQCGNCFTSVQVMVVAWVLDLNVSYFIKLSVSGWEEGMRWREVVGWRDSPKQNMQLLTIWPLLIINLIY